MLGLLITVLLSSSSSMVAAAFVYGLDLGNWSCPVTTNSSDAQKWYDTAWIQMWGFNHEEAIRCYEKALMYDPYMLMARVGLALSFGPNYNNEDGLSSDLAYNNSQQALTLFNSTSSSSLSPFNYTGEEMAVAYAVATRTQKNASATFWDPISYANSMREVYRMYGNTSNSVVALFAEALMLSQPWSLWEKDNQGNIVASSNETIEVVSALETALAQTPNYPPLCHLYVHVMEQSNNPLKALVHADHLRESVPDQGHLRHMPSHIDMWVGHYKDAVDANIYAIQADNKYLSMITNNNTQLYYKNYILHNHHFLLWASMYTGEKNVGMVYAKNLQAMIANPYENYTVIGGTQIIAADLDVMGFAPWQVLFKFAQWDVILSAPISTATNVYPATIATAYLHRAIAYAVTGRVVEAEAEKIKFEQAVQSPFLKGKKLQMNLMWNTNTTLSSSMGTNMGMSDEENECGVLNVGYYVLKGLIEHAKNNVTASVQCLTFAVAIEDSLRYAEPWGWMAPSRHTLGQVLLAHRMYTQAEQIFRTDLGVYPDNLWALKGLQQSLAGQGKSADAANVQANYTMAASRADIDVGVAFSLTQNQTTLIANSAPHQSETSALAAICSLAALWWWV